MVNPNNFMYLPALIASVGVVIALLISLLNLAKRVYEIIFLFIVMPLSASTISLDDGARFKTWREFFVSKILIAYGCVFAVNIFILLLPVITKMSIPGISGFGNSMFKIFMIIGGCMMIPAGQVLFVRLFGQAEESHSSFGFMRTAFYGGRIASALTFGLAGKAVKGTYKLGKKAVGAIKSKHTNKNGNNNNNDSDDDPSDKYSEHDTPNYDDSPESNAYSDNGSGNDNSGQSDSGVESYSDSGGFEDGGFLPEIDLGGDGL